MQTVATQILSEAHHKSGLSLREIARRAGTSHATLHAYIKGSKSPSTQTLTRIVVACDLVLDFELRPRIRRNERGLPRGEELAAVLRLASQFPARQGQTIHAPPFPGHG